MTREVWLKLIDHFGDADGVMSGLHIDGMNSVAPRYVGPEIPRSPDGEYADFWGIRSRLVAHEGGAYLETCHNPLAEAKTVDDLDDYPWPQADWFDYSEMRDHAMRASKKRVITSGGAMPFFYHNHLRGLEQSLLDPLLEPELTHEIVTRITEFYYQQYLRMFEACGEFIDLSNVTDDLGCQTGPLISPETYDEFYAPHHKRLIHLCKEFDVKVFHHDDGGCREFLPALVDMGIDILNPIQWKCPGMDMDELKNEYGARVCFHGGVDNQEALPFGSTDDVRDEVRHCIDALACDGTGYILASCHNLQVVSPIENIVAMYDEAHHYGRR